MNKVINGVWIDRSKIYGDSTLNSPKHPFNCYHVALTHYQNKRDVTKQIGLLQQMGKRTPFLAVSHCNSVMDTITKSFLDNGKKYELANRVMAVMDQQKIWPNIYTYTNLISAAAKAEKSDKVMLTVTEMEILGIAPNKVFLTTVITSFVKHGLIENALEVFKQMLNSGDENQRPDGITISVLIKGLCMGNKFHEALTLFDSLKDLEIPADVSVFASMINGLRRAKMHNEALEVYQKMVQQKFTPGIKILTEICGILIHEDRIPEAMELLKGAELDTVAITLLIQKLSEFGKTDEALKMYQEWAYKIEPDTKFINSVIDMYFKQNRISEATNLFREMSNKGISPNFETYLVMIGAIYKSRSADLLKLIPQLYREMEENLDPSFYLRQNSDRSEESDPIALKTQLILMNIEFVQFAKTEDPKKVVERFFELKDQGRPVDEITFNIVLDSFATNAQFHAAVNWFRLHSDLNLTPTEYHFNTIIKAALKSGDIFSAKEWLLKMREFLAPDQITLVQLINYCAAHDPPALPGFLQLTHPIKASPHVCDSLITYCVATQRPTEAKKVFQELISGGLVPTVSSCNKILKILENENDIKGIRDIHHKMKNWNLSCNARSYAPLIAALVNSGQREEAYKICEKMQKENIFLPYDVRQKLAYLLQVPKNHKLSKYISSPWKLFAHAHTHTPEL